MKEYTKKTTLRAARTRSGRNESVGTGGSGGAASGSGSGGSSTGSGHTHSNLPTLEQLSTDDEGYGYITRTEENEDGSVSKTTEKIKAGMSDDSVKWNGHSFDDYIDQPLRKTDSPEFLSLIVKILTSKEFQSGALGHGFRIAVDDNGHSSLEIDEITVRKAMKVAELVIQQITHQGGLQYYTAASIECSSMEIVPGGYKCFFDTKSGSVPNMFKAGDQARCQRFDLGITKAKYYWRLVTEVGEDYIVLDEDDCDTGSGIPEAGDNIVQLGNRTDKGRQKATVINVIGSDAPRIEMYEGIDSYNLTGKLITVLGVVDGKVGIYTNYGKFNNVQIGTGSSGLENLAEWAQKQEQIDKAEADAAEAKGLIGNSILDTDVLFIQTASSTQAPPLPELDENGDIKTHNGWYTDAPTWKKDRYIWQTTYVKKSDKTGSFSDPVCISGRDGGSVTVQDSSVTYQKSKGGTTPPTGEWAEDIPATADDEFLWTRTVVLYSDGKSTTSYSVSRNGKPGDPGKDATTIVSKDVKYAKSKTAEQPDDSEFIYESINDLGISKGDYVWSKTTVHYSDNTELTSYGVNRIGTDGINGIGKPGNDGKTSYVHFAYASGITGSLPHPDSVTDFNVLPFTGAKYIGVCTDFNEKDPDTHSSYDWSEYKGADGVGVKSITEQYYLSTSRTEFIGGSWSDTRPDWEKGKYIWTRSKITYTDENVEYAGEICATGDSGTSVRAQYSPNGIVWYPNYADGHKYMRTSSDNGVTWTPAIRIVAEDGKPGDPGKDGSWVKFQWAKNTSSTDAPVTGWQDTPMAASAGEYVWLRSGTVTPPATSPAVWGTAVRLTGDRGNDGESVYMLDLSNEVSGIACDKDGNVLGDYPTSQATVYKGSTKVASGISYSIAEKTGIDASIDASGKVTLKNMTSDTASVTVQAVVSGVTLTSSVSLYKVVPGKDGDDGSPATVYSLLASVSNVIRSMDGTLSESTVTCTKYKTTGSTEKVVTTDKYLYAQRIFSDGNPEAFSLIAGTSVSVGSVSVTDNTDAIIFELRNSSETSGYVVLDRERVPVFADAAEFIDQINGENFLTIPEKRALREKIADITSCKGTASQFSGTITRNMLNGTAWVKVTKEQADADASLKPHIDFYRSRNMGEGNSYSTTQLVFNLKYDAQVKIEVISDGESNYDYLALSKMDETANLTSSNVSIAEVTTKGVSNQRKVISKTYDLKKGVHKLQVMYLKDGTGNTGTDSGYYRITTEYDGRNTGLSGSFHRLYWQYESTMVSETDNMADCLDYLTSYLENTCHLWEDTVTDFTPAEGETAEPFRKKIEEMMRAYYEAEDHLRENGPVSDVEYLKQLFPNASMMVNGAVIARIVGVTDIPVTDDNTNAIKIVAGLNGTTEGASFNSDGLTDATHHGKVLLFAGADGVQSIGTAKTRIYEDGTIVTRALIAEDSQFTGKITATSGQIGGFKIQGISMTGTDGVSTVTLSPTDVIVKRENSDFEVIAALGNSVLPGVSGLGGLGFGVISKGTRNMFGDIAIGGYFSASGVTQQNSKADYGSHALFLANGTVAGFRPVTRRLTAGDTLSKMDSVIFMTNSSSATLNLCTTPEQGQMYYVIHTTTTSFTLSGNGKSIRRVDTNSITTTLSISNRELWILFYDGLYWEAVLV